MVVKVIENWILILGLTNLMLLLFGLVFFIPRNKIKIKISDFCNIVMSNLKYLIIIFGVVAFHLIEVNILDSYFTNIIGIDFANSIQAIEDSVVYWFSQNWSPILLYYFVLIYIIIYPFTLWFSPLYFLISDEKKAMKTLAYGLLLTYTIALPFYLFMPVTNVYTYYGIDSPLQLTIPGIEQFFYSTTTHNNCFPSLHVAVTLLIARSVTLTKNKKYKYFTYFCAVSVIISVIYLAIHWIIDVIGGILLALVVFYILKRFIK